MKLEFSAGGLVFRRVDDKIEFVLILDSHDQWTFPKGHIEKGEMPEAAAQREVQEEIGLNDLLVLDLLEKSDYWFREDELLIHKFVYFYLMESKVGELKHQVEEIQEARWFDPQKALKIIGYKKQNEKLLKKACGMLNLKLE